MKNFLSIRLLFLFSAFIFTAKAQATLNANGSGDTYSLINSVLAPGHNVVEASDLPSGTHPAFGQHIKQVFDATLNKYVFEFYSHLAEDNDISTGSTDRQRVEIKTYASSPASLIGTAGETVTYKWRFKIPVGYQPSSTFSHLHQIKPVDGDDADPLFTLTARKGTPNKLELTYTANSAGSTIKPVIADLSFFEGNWVEATENVEVGATGKYSIVLKRISDAAVLMTYTNSNILTIRSDNSFVRPKWGIYRSIVNPADLRDEAVRFSDFSITEGASLFAGTTYFWVGGATGDINLASSWNTALDGSGTDRSTPATDDVLIFDGSNISGAVPSTGTVTPLITAGVTIGQLFFQNAATVILQRNGGGGNTGTSSITLNGDGTGADDFMISANSSLTIKSIAVTQGLNIIFGSATGPVLATGKVLGTLSILDGGFSTTRITAANPGSLIFANGSTFTSNLTLAASYPFGSGSTTPPAATLGVVFQSGSKLVYQAGNSVVGNTAAFQPIQFDKGSLLEMNANNPTGMFNTKTYANVLIKSPAVVTMAENFYNIDTLTINTGATFNMRPSGTSPISGNIINNGTFGAGAGITSANMILIGFVPQTISGTGTFNNIGAISVGTDASVTLAKNLNITGTTTSTITGKINLQTNIISGTGPFQLRPAATGTSTAATITANTVTLADASAYAAANVAVGARVTGTGISANTYIISTSSGTFTFTMSKPVTGSYPALSGSITNITGAATFETANTAGTDGSITTAGTKTYGSGTNYIFDAATITPFSLGLNAGSLTANANLSLNFPIRTYNTLALNNSILTTTATNILTLDSAANVTGASNSNYVNGPMKWRTTGTTPVVFPTGKAGSYRPVIVSPAATTASQYQAEYFNAGYGDYTLTAPVTSVNNTEYWDVQKLSGANASVGLTLNSVFTGTPNAPTGSDAVVAGHFTGGSWVFEGGNYLTPANIVNSGTVTTSSLSTFSPFTFAIVPLSVVPLKLISFSGNRSNGNINLTWTTTNENNVTGFAVEESTDGKIFEKIGTVNASNNSQTNKYNFASVNNATGNLYYRIKVLNSNGGAEYSDVIILRSDKNNSIVIYPNPVKNNLNISGLNENTVLKIVNTAGQTVLTQNVNAAAISINAEQLKPGVYLIEIYNNGKKTTSKIFIKE